MSAAERPSYEPRRSGNTAGRRTLNAIQVEEDIMRLSSSIDDLLEELDDLASAKSAAEWEWEKFRAREGLRASAEPGNGPGGRTTVDEREARVLERDTGQLFLKHLVAEAFYDNCKERIHARRSQLSALQTIAANLRAVST